jgi:RHS repeat-associated protein
MNVIHRANLFLRRGLALAVALTATQAALAAPPIVSTVPVDPNDPLQPHDIITGKITTLKGAVDIASVGGTWTWNPGDGSPTISGTVMPTATSFTQTDDAGFTPYYAIWIPHTYTGGDGDVVFATLTVTNTLGESDSEIYRMEIRDITLPVEVNVAIDEALWFMHRNMYRFNGAVTQANTNTVASPGIPMGRWDFPQAGGAVTASAGAAAINAFEANGYLEKGPASSPYTDTVARGMNYIIANLVSVAVVPQTIARPVGSPDVPDSNGNGLGITISGVDPPYQLGMLMDAIVASGAPTTVAITGPANVIGRTYRDIVQDMVDWYAMAQTDSAVHGGWQYGTFNNAGGSHDNSASGWAAIGLLAAEDVFGITVPPWVKTRNAAGLEATDTESATADTDGQHGYTSPSPAWGAFGVTGAALVQMALDDIQATTSLTPDERWIRAENFMRRHFNDAATGNNFKNYYYAMFNFAKAMRTAVPEEVVLIGTNTSVGCGMDPAGAAVCGGAAAPLDWYLDPTQGLARTVVSYQTTSGNNIGMFIDRTGDSQGANQDNHTTPWATQILTRTLFQAGPVSRARGTPNPGAADSPIALDGSESFHQDPARSLVSYQWDFDNDGTFDATGVTVAHSFACPTLPVPCSYQVRLRVTDDNVPARFDDDIVVIEITIPPRPPTADAGGAYLVCLNESFQLDGSGSSDVDEGTSESGAPPFDTITSYGWELDSVSPFDFDEATGLNPTTSFASLGVRNVGLRVADNTALAFPTAAQPNLTDSTFDTVNVVDCGCIGPVSARVKPGKVQLTWSPVPGAVSYDIFRSTDSPTQGISILRAAHVTNYATYLDANLTNGETYFYRVRAIGADGLPLCASSLPVAATPQADRRARPETVVVPDVAGQGESEAIDTLVTALLAIGDISRVNDATMPAGDVIRTVPAAGARVAEGSAIALVVSLGPVLTEVPDVIGDPSADAQAAIVAAGLTVGAITQANDNAIPAGSVVSQEPVGGLLVVGGSAVDLVVSLGPQLFSIPNVVGQTQAAATGAITGAGFALGAVTNVNNDAVPAGLIISQDPPAGGTHVLGTTVDVVVSLGPVTVAVPNIIGQTQGAAETAIVGAGLGVGNVGQQNSSVVAAGLVITQSPGAGTQALPGSSVDFTISLGPVQVQVPNVVGLTQAAAETAITGASLSVGNVTQQNSLTVPAGNVISQNPLAGATANEGSFVDVVVSLGPVQVTVPNVVGQTQAAATASIIGADLVLGTVGTATHPTIPAGIVLSQAPAAGNVVNEDTAVNIVVSLGAAPVIVPNVVGQTQATASAAIVAADLVVGTVGNATSATVPAGSVISQDPAGGTTVGEGSVVNLVVSLGPAQVAVPNVVGQAQAAGTNAITGAGLVLGTVTNFNSDTAPSGQILDQTPAAGTLVNEGSAVNLFVSIGPADIAVPNVVGQSQVGAEATLAATGLALGTVTTQSSALVAAGDVISQNPTAGTLVGAGTAVNLVVSSGAPADAVPPSVAGLFNASPPNYAPGTPALLSIVASDNSGVVTVTGTLDGGVLPITRPTTTIATAGLAIGPHTVVLTATDPGGLTDTDALIFYVVNTADTTGPTAIITAPAADAALTVQVNVTGTANDANLVKYELQLAPTGTSDFLTFHTGTTPVVGGTLGQLDPTLFTSGLYTLRLLVQDAGGNRTNADRPIRLDSASNAPGAFRLEFVDLDVPVAGLPITVKRIYDSRDRGGKGDFGFGWHMEVIRSGRYENNRLPGDGWTISSGGGFFNFPCMGAVNETKVHVTEVRFSETEFYRFKLNLVKDGTVGSSGACFGTVNFSQIGGIPGAGLAILDDTNVVWLNGGDQLTFDLGDARFGDVYQPNGVRLTTIDGRQFDFSANGGLTRIRDNNGNTLTFGANAITHSSGTGIQLTRDGQGRITSLRAPNAATRNYAYDLRGDLVTATDFMSNATTFGYEAGHLLENIVDPLGNMPMRYEYDAAGRVVKQYDAEGNSITIDNNVAAGTTTVTDRIGTVRTFSYDTRGNITSASDGTTTVQRTFDARGNKLTEIDQLGNLRVFSYDANDNLLTERDPLGNTTSYSYGAGTRITGVTDAQSNSSSFAYDAQGNPTSVTNADGVVVQAFVNNAAGSPTQVTTLGGAVNLTYSPQGRVTRRQGPGPLDTSFTYDANGRVLTQVVARTVNGLPVNETTSFTYNANGQMTSKTDPLGGETTYEYNAAGHLSATTDENGNATTFTRDKRGNPTRKDYANGTFEAFTYDAQGRLTAVLDRLGRTTFYEIDARGNLVKTIHPGGSTVVNTYDLADRLLTSTDQLGRVTSYTYNAVGAVLTKTDAANGITRYSYDSLGALTSIEDPLGRVTTMQYDHSTFGAPRIERTTFADTTVRQQTYAPSGRVASITDEGGGTTSYTYDGAGNPLTVTNALGHVTSYAYDSAGNRITETDAAGRITRMSYDANRRLTSRTKPTGETETFAYDLAGNLLEHQDFRGQSIQYEYDARNRLVRKIPQGGVATQYTYTATDKIARIDDPNGGVTTYGYDVLDRVTSIVYPSGDTLTYTYDAIGNRLSVAGPQGTTAYTYDALNRMISATTGGQTTTYTYDAVGNATEVTYPNGTENQYAYNSRNRITGVSVVGAGGVTLASQAYVMNAVGNRTSMIDAAGRVVNYTYDATHRLTSESDNVSGGAVTTSYTYDNVGNRLSMNAGGVVTNYTYDASDRLLTEGGLSYTYDANGNLLSRSDGVTYSYDAENRLTSHSAGGVTTTYGYDTFGNRVRSATGGAVTNYLVDPKDSSGLAQVVAEKNGAGVLTRSYVYGNDLIRQTAGGVASYYHADALGSTRALTDAGGGVTDTYDYTAFGQLAGSSGSTANNYRFAGEQLDPASDLYYLRARYMDPRVGRFISTDPFAGVLNNPATLHDYLYAVNNPVNFTDPTGQFVGGIAGISVSISIATTLSSIAITAYGIYNDIQDVYDKINTMVTELPTLKLNKELSAAELRVRIIEISAGTGGLNINLDTHLGGGAVGKASEIAKDLSGKGGDALAFIYSYSMGEWMAHLPAVVDPSDNKAKPGFYLNCGFNTYLNDIYKIQLLNGGIKGAALKPMLRVLGMWLNYTNLIALVGSTAGELGSGVPPPPPPSGACPISSALP